MLLARSLLHGPPLDDFDWMGGPACKLAEQKSVLHHQGTPPVSYYTLFKGWLPLGPPPGFSAPRLLLASRLRGGESTFPLVLCMYALVDRGTPAPLVAYCNTYFGQQQHLPQINLPIFSLQIAVMLYLVETAYCRLMRYLHHPSPVVTGEAILHELAKLCISKGGAPTREPLPDFLVQPENPQ